MATIARARLIDVYILISHPRRFVLDVRFVEDIFQRYLYMHVFDDAYRAIATQSLQSTHHHHKAAHQSQ